MGKRKAASLSGSLLSSDKADSSAGFVISLVDKLNGEPPGKGRPSVPSRPVAGSAKGTAASVPGEGEPSANGAGSGKAEARGATIRRLPQKDRTADRTAKSVETSAQDLVQALRRGDISSAEEIFASMTGLSGGRVQGVLYGADGRDLATACRAMGIEQLQFVSIFLLSRRLGLGEASPNPRKLSDVVNYFDSTDQETARQKLNNWFAGQPAE